jgi:hypothetical protein
VRRNVDRECARRDIDPDVWAEFFFELVSHRDEPDSYAAIRQTLNGPRKGKFFLAGKAIPWSGDVFHYERIDRFVVHSLNLPIAGDQTLERIASLIEDGICTGDALHDKTLGRPDRPNWVTDDELSAEPESDRVRDRLGLRSLNRAGYRLVEIRYREAYLAQKKIEIRAPTVLDSWQDGAKQSWIFTKRPEEGNGPESGRTIDISETDGKPGAVEAVHGSVIVKKGEGPQIRIRVLHATTRAPDELSLWGLLRNRVV